MWSGEGSAPKTPWPGAEEHATGAEEHATGAEEHATGAGRQRVSLHRGNVGNLYWWELPWLRGAVQPAHDINIIIPVQTRGLDFICSDIIRS